MDVARDESVHRAPTLHAHHCRDHSQHVAQMIEWSVRELGVADIKNRFGAFGETAVAVYVTGFELPGLGEQTFLVAAVEHDH